MIINFFVKIITRGYGHFELVSYVKDCKCSVIRQIFDTDEVMNIWKVLENKDKYTNGRFFSFLKDMGKSEMHYEIVFNKPIGCKDDYRITIYKEPDKIRMIYFTGEKARVIMEKLIGDLPALNTISNKDLKPVDTIKYFITKSENSIGYVQKGSTDFRPLYVDIGKEPFKSICKELFGESIEELKGNCYEISLYNDDSITVNSSDKKLSKVVKYPKSLEYWDILNVEKRVVTLEDNTAKDLTENKLQSTNMTAAKDFSSVMDPQILGEAEWEKEFSKIDQNINNPDHYTKGRKYEPIDVINDWELNFNLGNVVKYISRYNRKGNVPVEDLKKAAFYLNDEIERLIKK